MNLQDSATIDALVELLTVHVEWEVNDASGSVLVGTFK